VQKTGFWPGIGWSAVSVLIEHQLFWLWLLAVCFIWLLPICPFGQVGQVAVCNWVIVLSSFERHAKQPKLLGT